MVVAGYAEPGQMEEWRKRAERWPERSRMVGGGMVVKQRDIPRILETEMDALAEYNRYKLMGFPFSGGWREQPAVLIDIIEPLLVAEKALEAEKFGNSAR